MDSLGNYSHIRSSVNFEANRRFPKGLAFAQSQFHRETHNLLFQPTVLEDLQTAPQWPLFEHLWQVTSFAGQCDPEIFRSGNSGSKAGVWMDF